MDKKLNLIYYGIHFVCALALVFLVLVGKNIFNQTEYHEVMKILTDSFFAIGILYTCFGLLVIFSNHGVFDMLKFGTSKLVDIFKSDPRGKYKTYYEYKQSKKDKSKTPVEIFVVGFVLVLISLIFLYFYYN